MQFAHSETASSLLSVWTTYSLQGFQGGPGNRQIDQLRRPFCPAGITIYMYSKVLLAKKFRSDSFACLWKPYSFFPAENIICTYETPEY